MVDTKTETKHQDQDKPVNPRDAIREKRERRFRLVSEGNGSRAGTVKVFAANEGLREVLRHPAHGARFRSSLSEGVEWPNDSFTKRRLADGSVRINPASGDEPAPADESLNPRQQSAARKEEQATKEEPQKNGSKPTPKSQPQQQPQPPAA